MQKFLLRIQRSVLEEAVVEFDIVGKSCCSVFLFFLFFFFWQ